MVKCLVGGIPVPHLFLGASDNNSLGLDHTCFD